MTSELVAYDPKNQPQPARCYDDFRHASEYFGRELFGVVLPPFLITLQRTRHAYGYFSPDRLANIKFRARHVYKGTKA